MEPEAVLGVATAAAAGAQPPRFVPVGQPMFAAATVCAADDRDFMRSLLPLGVGYESDPELALSLQAAANLGEAAAAVPPPPPHAAAAAAAAVAAATAAAHTVALEALDGA